MKSCERCGREYLDSYGSCPFCARPVPVEDLLAPQPTSRLKPQVIGAITSAVVLVLACVGWQVATAYFGARATLAGQQAACFSQQAQIERAAMMYSVDNGDTSAKTVADLVPKQLPAVPRCAAGGTYTLTWNDQQQPKATCSVHGWHLDHLR